MKYNIIHVYFPVYAGKSNWYMLDVQKNKWKAQLLYLLQIFIKYSALELNNIS